MPTNDDAVIIVDFEVDRRDLFRVNMELAKWRLLAGIAICLLLGLAFGYFFYLIDEPMVFLQTSPLFIGAALVAVGGQVLRLHAMSRKFVQALTPSQRKFRYTFPVNGEGYSLTSGDSSSQIAWKDIMQVVEKMNYFLIYRNRFEVRILPKRGFQTADIPFFCGMLISRIGDRAKLSTEST